MVFLTRLSSIFRGKLNHYGFIPQEIIYGYYS